MRMLRYENELSGNIKYCACQKVNSSPKADENQVGMRQV